MGKGGVPVDGVIESLRQFNLATVLLRMALAMLRGGAVGYGRTKKARSAGMRTYMLISIGAAIEL